MILRVTYNLEDYIMEIKQERKEELKDQIDSILKAEELDPKLERQAHARGESIVGKGRQGFLSPFALFPNDRISKIFGAIARAWMKR